MFLPFFFFTRPLQFPRLRWRPRCISCSHLNNGSFQFGRTQPRYRHKGREFAAPDGSSSSNSGRGGGLRDSEKFSACVSYFFCFSAFGVNTARTRELRHQRGRVDGVGSSYCFHRKFILLFILASPRLLHSFFRFFLFRNSTCPALIHPLFFSLSFFLKSHFFFSSPLPRRNRENDCLCISRKKKARIWGKTKG